MRREICMKIVLIRHGKSDWSEGTEDFDRPLNQRGFNDAPKVARALIKKGIQPDKIVTSSALRAYSTAEIMAKEFQCREIVAEPDLYLADSEVILDTVLSEMNEKLTILLFGHNPGISQAACQLLGKEVQMPTCSAVMIELKKKNREWFLKDSFLISPKSLGSC